MGVRPAVRPLARRRAQGIERAMTRVNLILLALLVASALGTVSAQHRSRQLFAELEREQGMQRKLDIEYRQLQLEQSTWAMHARIEKVALSQLKMQMPVPARVQVVARGDAATGAGMRPMPARGLRSEGIVRPERHAQAAALAGAASARLRAGGVCRDAGPRVLPAGNAQRLPAGPRRSQVHPGDRDPGQPRCDHRP
jgi:cell division protein FtsL